jgi:hypothetical protein
MAAKKGDKGKGNKGTNKSAIRAERAQIQVQASQEKIAQKGGVYFGSLISWNADKIDPTRAEARAVFGRVNMEALIPEITAASALVRAINEGAKPRDLLAFDTPQGAPVAYGIYKKVPGQGQSGDSFPPGARVVVDLANNCVLALPPEGIGYGIEEAMAWAEDIATRANHLLTHCGSRDVSAALVELAHRLCALPLRDRGGFYLLPAGKADTWEALEPGLLQLGFRPIAIKMFDCPENLAVAQAAASGALEADLAELAADLDKAMSDGMRQDMLERRVTLCDELGAKVGLYKDVLADLSLALEQRLEDLHNAFQKKLDDDAAAIAAGKPAPVSAEIAQKRSDAANKAWASRQAKGWTHPNKRAAAPAAA